jgi:hypothetical protein
VPRIEAKLRVFSFKTECSAQVEELKKTLTLIISAAKEVRDPCTDNFSGTLAHVSYMTFVSQGPRSTKKYFPMWNLASV